MMEYTQLKYERTTDLFNPNLQKGDKGIKEVFLRLIKEVFLRLKPSFIIKNVADHKRTSPKQLQDCFLSSLVKK